jgi:methyl-accepting chemotaxis protein
LERLTADFNRDASGIVHGLADSSGRLQAAAIAMSNTANETNERASSVSAAEELSSSINEISRQVGRSSQITLIAVEEAKRTESEVGQLAEAARRIGAVVALINDIASQTNL